MTLTPDDGQADDAQYAGDIARMRKCLQSVGVHARDEEIVNAWTDYSKSLCALWLLLPEDDSSLISILLEHGSSLEARWRAEILDCGDGSGDGILKLPDELLKQTGWKEGDSLRISKTDAGDVILRRTG